METESSWRNVLTFTENCQLRQTIWYGTVCACVGPRENMLVSSEEGLKELLKVNFQKANDEEAK